VLIAVTKGQWTVCSDEKKIEIRDIQTGLEKVVACISTARTEVEKRASEQKERERREIEELLLCCICKDQVWVSIVVRP
jgi:hypothetical protein